MERSGKLAAWLLLWTARMVLLDVEFFKQCMLQKKCI
jgi:hypothetical protein